MNNGLTANEQDQESQTEQGKSAAWAHLAQQCLLVQVSSHHFSNTWSFHDALSGRTLWHYNKSEYH